MNKKIIFTIILSLTLFCCIAQDNANILDSVFVYNSDTIQKFRITRNPKGDIAQIISDSTVSDIYTQKALFNYYENSKLEWVERYYWSEDVWKKNTNICTNTMKTVLYRA